MRFLAIMFCMVLAGLAAADEPAFATNEPIPSEAVGRIAFELCAPVRGQTVTDRFLTAVNDIGLEEVDGSGDLNFVSADGMLTVNLFIEGEATRCRIVLHPEIYGGSNDVFDGLKSEIFDAQTVGINIFPSGSVGMSFLWSADGVSHEVHYDEDFFLFIEYRLNSGAT